MILGSRMQRTVAAVSVTLLTVAVIGLTLLSSTPLGCGPAKALHIKLSPNRCANVASTISNPSPFPTYVPPPSPIPLPVVSANPFPQPASNPFPQPASNPFPQPASSYPYPDSGSSGFPPFGFPASAGGAAGLALNCRLPIYAGGPGSGGFIVFPNGNFVADPRSAIAVPSPSPGGASPAPPPQGQGPGPGPGYQYFNGISYDQVDSKWLPVPYRWVSHSPAGMVYAYPGQPDGVYVQNITNGTSMELGEGKTWSVLDVTPVGVFAVTGTTGGLWLLRWDGSVVQRISTGYWQGVAPAGDAVAYGTATSSVPQGAGNTILQYNFGTGATTDYFSVYGKQSSVAGFDFAGNPVIYVQGQPALQIYIGLGPNRGNQIADLSGTNFYPNGLVADRHGLWLAAYNGVALYVQGAGWYYMSGLGGQPAGGCN